MPITAIALLDFWDMACSLSVLQASFKHWRGLEHGRTIPLPVISMKRFDLAECA
jgi:hypothetical protein